MYDQRWRFDVAQMRADVMPAAGLHKAQVRLDAPLERTPYSTTTEQLLAVGIVVVGLERERGHH